jgi:raffinose/stachyose/melibiose transport system permease protein
MSVLTARDVEPEAIPTAHKKRSKLGKLTTLHLVSIAVATVIALPIYFGVTGSFKSNGELSNNPLGLPKEWLFSNYTDILKSDVFWRSLWNSAVIGLATVVLVVGCSSMAAYVFARFAFRGREFLYTVFAAGLMFPFAVAVLPLFVLLRQMHLLDNPLGVILPQAAFGLPLTIIILRSFFRTIPAEIEESAVLDGCGRFGFFWRVLLPMSRPALATVSVLALVASWNNFFLPLVLFNNPKLWTLPVGVQQFQGQYFGDTGKILAYVILSMVPALAFYAIAERQLIGGLTTGVTRS